MISLSCARFSQISRLSVLSLLPASMAADCMEELRCLDLERDSALSRLERELCEEADLSLDLSRLDLRASVSPEDFLAAWEAAFVCF